MAIDSATIEKIKDAANIVDVVGEFVTLRKSGANYKGLCPFHDEKTPSFYAFPATGTCHCFGCGKGGTSVTFIMEHEQMTYPEALRWLASKYHIEVHERELTDEERREQSERESMFIVNEWVAAYFQEILNTNADGQAIGMEYFRSRGFRDDIIKKFRLGYDLTNRLALAAEALGKGYREEFLVKTGVCYKNDRGELVDRYAGRVIFPWIGLSGKVVGFGGRLLDSRTKGVSQKYVNSPDSDVYHKNHELYGIFQAKKAIAKEDCVYMVEGYTDVLSMHQCGIENVVANSGTALSVHQIHTLHRFTSNIVLVYDGDSAGIHAAMRGTDMLLSEGMNVNVLFLPDNDDPDSFSHKHTAEDFRQYIEGNKTDFIQFKTKLLLDGVTDPIKRSEGISSIAGSISAVKTPVLRDTYAHDFAQSLGVNELTVINEMNKFIRTERERVNNAPRVEAGQAPADAPIAATPQYHEVEKLLIQAVIRHGEKVILDNIDIGGGKVSDINVAQYISANLAADNLTFRTELFNRILAEAAEHSDDDGFVAEAYFIHHEDIGISKFAESVSVDKYQLINVDKKAEPGTDEEWELAAREAKENLRNQTLHLVLDFRMDYVERRLEGLRREISLNTDNAEKVMELMTEFRDTQQIRNALAKKLGNDIIA